MTSPIQAQPQQQSQRGPPKIGKKFISPLYAKYLRQQAHNILLAGGSEADVVKFWEVEGHKMPDLIPEPRQFGEPEIKEPGFLRGLSMRALQGITFGFGDEALGSVLGVLTGEGARGGIETYRKELEAWNRKHGLVGAAAEFGASFITGGGVIKGVAFAGRRLGARQIFGAAGRSSPTIGQRAVAAAAQGGVAGAISGAGHSEGGMSQRTFSALFGTGLGVLAGAGLVGGARTVGSIARPIARSVTRGFKFLQEKLPGVGSPEQHARELLARGIKQDGLDFVTLRKDLINFANTGSPVAIADLGGDATLRLAADALSLRTPAKQKLVELLLQRQAEQGERLSADLFSRIFRGTKLGLRNSYETVEALTAVRKAAAQPLYEEAFEEVVKVTPRMQKLLKHPTFRKAYGLGRNIANDEDLAGIGHGLEVPDIFKGAKAADKIRASLEAQGFKEENIAQVLAKTTKQFPDEIPVRALDYMKRGLDIVIEGGIKAEKPSLDRQAAKTLRSLLDEVLTEADNQISSYGKARSIYRGFSESIDATNLGKDFIGKAPEVIRKELTDLHPVFRDFYRLGSAQSIYEQAIAVTNKRSDVATKFFGGQLFGGTSLRAKQIEALFPDAPEVANEFMRKVASEAQISQTTRQAVSAARGATIEATEGAIEGSVPTVRATGAVMVANIARTGVVRARTGFAQDVSDELALLYSKGLSDPAELDALLDVLEHTQRQLQRRASVASRAAIAIGETVGQVR